MTEPVPEWVHMAEVPPTDEEPDPLLGTGLSVIPDPAEWAADDEDSGLWAGIALMLLVAVVSLVFGIVIGRMTA